MNRIKAFIKKYASGFSFYYAHLRNRVFLILLLSFLMSFLDALGLTMFLPLIQVFTNNGSIDFSAMGKIGGIIENIQNFVGPLSLGKIILVMFIFFLLKGVIKYLTSIYLIILQQSFIRDIRLKLIRGMNQLSFKKFMLSDSGRIQNTLSGEIDQISQSFSTYFATLKSILMTVVYLGFVFFINAQFAFLLIGIGIISHFLFKSIYSKTRETSRNLTQENHGFQGQLIQFVSHFKYLRSTGVMEVFSQKIEGSIFKIESFRKRLGFLSSIGGAVIEPAIILVLSLIIWIQIKYFGDSLSLTLVSLLFFYRVLNSLIGFQAQWNTFLRVSGSLENVESFLTELKSNKMTDGSVEFHQLNRGIKIENLFFSYTDQPTLKNINLEVLKNESIAFVGASGSGKTTLVNLMVGLLEPELGNIFIDQNSLQELKINSFQNKIGYVTQDPVIFNDSIYHNVTLWAPKNDENLKAFNQSIQKASLTDFVNELTLQEETLLGNNGINLSGGQKQRISIARELYKNIQLLILDEATSALDSATEKTIQNSIEALKGKYTLLIIAHRLATIRNADRIVFMDKGKILAVDSFENLRENEPKFRRLVELQEL